MPSDETFAVAAVVAVALAVAVAGGGAYQRVEEGRVGLTFRGGKLLPGLAQP